MLKQVKTCAFSQAHSKELLVNMHRVQIIQPDTLVHHSLIGFHKLQVCKNLI